MIVYRYDPHTSHWVVRPEDNPELRNFNSRGIGGIANPFHAYITKESEYILYGTDGSRRIFEGRFLKKWIDHERGHERGQA